MLPGCKLNKTFQNDCRQVTKAHSELVTVPARVLEQWAKEGMPLPGDDFAYKPIGVEIPYEELNLEQPWEQFNIEHELTRKGIQKFVSDYKSTLRKAS